MYVLVGSVHLDPSSIHSNHLTKLGPRDGALGRVCSAKCPTSHAQSPHESFLKDVFCNASSSFSHLHAGPHAAHVFCAGNRLIHTSSAPYESQNCCVPTVYYLGGFILILQAVGPNPCACVAVIAWCPRGTSVLGVKIRGTSHVKPSSRHITAETNQTDAIISISS